MKRKIISSILITTFLTGCDTHPIVQPEGKVVVDNKNYTMIGSDYSWKENKVEVNTLSSPDINELADQFQTIEVKKGDTIKLEIERNPSAITAIKYNEDGTSENVEIKDNKITMPQGDGYYIYKLKTTWDKGKETFVFDVTVN
ncbi:hypothetical protein [Rummeliibacillus pycnus]|uniref:hypothetical protein n=1 Tax=Rummeliibacillus pycnus TaxID=101070 RepID=UPI000C9B6C17|nr:hypothetical protein [Rummeliibacillus pycnus]